MPTGLEEFRTRLRADKKQGRVILIVSAILFAALIVLSLCVCYDTDTVTYEHTLYLITPLQAVKNVFRYIKYEISFLIYGLHNGTDWAEVARLNETYTFVTGEYLSQLILTILSGAVLSLSGAVYQSAMRNPMAVPTMLGVNSGVNLAQVLLVSAFGSSVYGMMGVYYASSYLMSAAVLAVILLCGKVAGGKHMSVVDMLLAGTVINRLLNILINYYRDAMSETNLLVYEELSEKTYSALNTIRSIGVMAGVCVLILIPVFSMRFSMNTLSFDDEDVRCLGVRPTAMRLYAIIAGAILTSSAMIHYGNIGMLDLMLPNICRYVFVSYFRKLNKTSAFYGAFLLTIGWFVSEFTYIGYYQIPVGSILSIITLPIILIFNARQRHGWD
ncbi:MAG: iron ABC transporter permease [Oscillospiraceae bacterium]|nr:iron ABC transporter permease [Oscillospiraceae bacterium]